MTVVLSHRDHGHHHGHDDHGHHHGHDDHGHHHGHDDHEHDHGHHHGHDDHEHHHGHDDHEHNTNNVDVLEIVVDADSSACSSVKKESSGCGCSGKEDAKQECPYKKDGKQECPYKKDGKHECPYKKDGKHECPYKEDAKHECPYKKDGKHECPYKEDAKHECPYKSKKEYSLYYFDIKGRAEVSRNLFKVAGIKFEDIRLDAEKFKELKQQGVFSYGQVPALKIKTKDEEFIVSQSRAIERYLAREFKLYGKTSIESLLVDVAVEGAIDARTFWAKAAFGTEEEKVANAKLFREEKFEQFLKGWEKLIKGPFVLGDEFSYADLAIYDLIQVTKERGFADFDIEKHSLKTAKLVDSVNAVLTN